MLNIRIFPTLGPQRATKAMISMVGLFTLMEVLALPMVKPQLAGVLSHDRLIGRVNIMFGPVVTTEAHLANAGGRTHSNNTAELSSMIEALFFLGPHGPVARDSRSCISYDSKHAAGVCLGTIQARTNVQLGLPCQRLLLKVQLRLRFTMQHVYSHAQNLGNDCADHAATLATFGLASNQNISTRWAHPSFDSDSCFATCHNLGDVLEKLRDVRTARVSASQRQIRS